MIATGQLEELLENILSRYGYDFTGYSRASLKRRIDGFYVKGRFTSFADMQRRLMDSTAYFMYFVEEVTVNVTEMFRDPAFYQTLREKILPVLATYPFIRIWHAGCSTGEEVYSMAILLKEANLLHKSILYATDLNQAVIEKAKTGIYPINTMQQNSVNYIRSGGKEDFSGYYHANYNLAKFDEGLAEKMIFSTHNLVSDSSFNLFQLILCRNVLIYFERDLQKRVLELFDQSLDSLGFLAMGSKESLRFSSIASHYQQIENKEKIWRKSR
ncbi:protein-glutamate O-methyltransferase CheR [Ferruginibacter paludis]|jgi:chemotaxis protein methyltransferase CheR|uniref:CheR family methyltransferase n=1 Tax=Ferruginibacter TaxID=1004303 RepID=UPI0025B4997B|nr:MULTISPECIES: protein-glutamate O-methyltransferase CheR [Ferruginibacter]MDB5276996.1 protein-glutamate O-methyltransferase CheR [Ferruginibacter sp.]MDN3656233.1 protein-glutamate O-methyltransferase CheR [Ferruginibacter paludis]